MTDDNPLGKFKGATRYVLDDELAQIVNITIALEMPLLLKGELAPERQCWPMPLPRLFRWTLLS